MILKDDEEGLVDDKEHTDPDDEDTNIEEELKAELSTSSVPQKEGASCASASVFTAPCQAPTL